MSSRQTEPIYQSIMSARRWDAASALDPQHVQIIAAQAGLGYNLADQMLDDSARKHVFRALSELTPDKRRLGHASFFLWLQLTKAERNGTSDPQEDFVAILAGLTAFEEFFRAVSEVYGEPTLVVTKTDGDTVKCELAMLDTRQGLLLDPQRLARMLGSDYSQTVHDCFAAVRAVRNKVQHGEWLALKSVSPAATCHLIVKLLVTLSATVNIRKIR